MYKIIEQTWEEKFTMYNKLSKKELITMLIESNKHLHKALPKVLACESYYLDTTNTGMLCLNCGCGKYGHNQP